MIEAGLKAAALFGSRVVKPVLMLGQSEIFGAHALPLTPEGRIVLVRLRYAPGWRLPGGRRGRDEDPKDAALRELREEIGLKSHGEVTYACDLEEPMGRRRDCMSLVLVRDVIYAPRRWSLEVEAVREATLDALLEDMAPVAERWIARLRPFV